ncbi:MAG: LysM domain-containing protein [Planctomycetota bacterium]
MKNFVIAFALACAALGVIALLPSREEASAQEATESHDQDAEGFTKYTAQEGDSWWKLAHVKFKDRGLNSADIEGANPGKKPLPGTVLLIPEASKVETVKRVLVDSPKKSYGQRLVRAEEGDTAFSLALECYSDRKRFRDIMAANPSMPWSDRLIGGEYILLPAVATESTTENNVEQDEDVEVTVIIRHRLK